ncbi:MAG: hypothetical protein ACLPPF_08580 [Rhodomicrobium sp.]
MAASGDRARNGGTHLDEWFSIILAVLATIAVPVAITMAKGEPTSPISWTIPVWIGLIYLIVQMAFLLNSASQVRALGVLDSVIAIFPLVAGLVLLALNIADHSNFPLSNYQMNALAVLIVASAAEFLLTIWIRFVVTRRTIGLGGDGN